MLQPILLRRNRYQLIELNLVHCSIPGSVTKKILEILMMENSIKRLSLVNANLNETNIDYLCRMLT